jgi:hypothetical protein
VPVNDDDSEDDDGSDDKADDVTARSRTEEDQS